MAANVSSFSLRQSHQTSVNLRLGQNPGTQTHKAAIIATDVHVETTFNHMSPYFDLIISFREILLQNVCFQFQKIALEAFKSKKNGV